MPDTTSPEDPDERTLDTFDESDRRKFRFVPEQSVLDQAYTIRNLLRDSNHALVQRTVQQMEEANNALVQATAQ